MVKSQINIPLVVGGGIRNGKDANKVAEAGADIIITGTIVEDSTNIKKKISELTRSIG
jgi:phosphoglycerol geranylgeranyltransferase